MQKALGYEGPEMPTLSIEGTKILDKERKKRKKMASIYDIAEDAARENADNSDDQEEEEEEKLSEDNEAVAIP